MTPLKVVKHELVPMALVIHNTLLPKVRSGQAHTPAKGDRA